MKKITFAVIALGILNLCLAQPKIDKKLQKKIHLLVGGFRGDVGIYIYNLKSNKIAGLNIDSVFPTASMVKVPILIGIMDKTREENCSIARN